MTIEEYKQKQEVLKEANRLVSIIKRCKSLDDYKSKKNLHIDLDVSNNKEKFYSWRNWALNDYDEDLLLDIMCAIKKYQARLEEELNLL